MHFASLAAAALAFFFLVPNAIASPFQSLAAPVDLARRSSLVEREASQDLYLKDDDDHKVFGEIENIFGAIDEIPYDVLEKGDEATDKWFVEHGYRPKHDKREVMDRDLEDRSFWSVAKCVGAISAFIASNAIGAAKLLRIKKYIEALGGIRKSAELLLKASNNAERLKEGGELLALLAGEILGTSMVANNC